MDETAAMASGMLDQFPVAQYPHLVGTTVDHVLKPGHAQRVAQLVGNADSGVPEPHITGRCSGEPTSTDAAGRKGCSQAHGARAPARVSLGRVTLGR